MSRATIKRLRDGQSQPTLGTLRELALAQGLDIAISVVPASDPDAAIAARVMVEKAMAGVSVRPEVASWTRRLARYGADEPAVLAAEAGRLSSPLHGQHSRYFAPRPGIDQARTARAAASAAVASHIQYAVSGAPAATQLLGGEVAGPTLLWVADTEPVTRALGDTFKQVDRYQPAGIVIAPAPQELFVDTAELHGVRFAAPVQVVIDLHGAGMSSIAAEVAKGW